MAPDRSTFDVMTTPPCPSIEPRVELCIPSGGGVDTLEGTLMKYQAPKIESITTLAASLDAVQSKAVISDAEVKHGVRPLGSYEAPGTTGLGAEQAADVSKHR